MVNVFFFMFRKLEKRKWTLLVLEEKEIDRYVFCIKYLTDLKPLVINSFKHLDLNNYEVCLCVMFIFINNYLKLPSSLQNTNCLSDV